MTNCGALALVVLCAACERSAPLSSPGGGATATKKAEPKPDVKASTPGSASGRAQAARVEELRDVKELCVTQGALAANGPSAREVHAPKMRGVFPSSRGDYAKLRFRYKGPTATVERLGSGLERRQLGLKLAARDPCNLLYVMWRLEPKSEIVVSFKSNPSARSSRECGNEGYTNLRPSSRHAPPLLEPNSEHELQAEVEGGTLRAKIDGATVWEGAVPAEAQNLKGPVGVRSDNVEWTMIEYRARRDPSAKAEDACGAE